MGDDGFETSLSMIDRLDGSQRRRALRALALAQAADGGALDDALDRDGATAWPPHPFLHLMIACWTHSGATGSRALAARIAVRRRFAAGVAPAASRATVASPAARRSIR